MSAIAPSPAVGYDAPRGSAISTAPTIESNSPFHAIPGVDLVCPGFLLSAYSQLLVNSTHEGGAAIELYAHLLDGQTARQELGG